MFGLTEYHQGIETCHEDQIDPKMWDWVQKHFTRQPNGKWRKNTPNVLYCADAKAAKRRPRYLDKGWRVWKVQKAKK